MNHRSISLTAIIAAMLAATPFGLTGHENAGHILTVDPVAENAVRVRVSADTAKSDLPEIIYSGLRRIDNNITVSQVDGPKTIKIFTPDNCGLTVTHSLRPSQAENQGLYEATAALRPEDMEGNEYQFGLGQFQDDYTNIFGLSRRLTQVNTQISNPMFISSKGYGILWHNYGLTEFNPGDRAVALERADSTGRRVTVDVTTTEGGRKEVRENNIFTAEIEIPESGNYSLLLDVGQKMARRHNLTIDGETVIEMSNIWLPPTASKIVNLTKGRHTVKAELTGGDRPKLHYKKVTDTTVLTSPVADNIDYTVIFGTPDEIISTYRSLTGESPLMPKWALGYIHCRERFHSQDELLATATRFREEGIPIDVIVQDWQYWGKHGWNAMQFDTDNYPSPKEMTDSLHAMDIKMMLSVWAKIDGNSEVGRQMSAAGHFIPGTTWVDFFNPDAASAYWTNFREKLLPTGIDAWWQDATEPENDDLEGRVVDDGKIPGERVRNVFPMLVNKTVYEGLLNDRPEKRPLILTRSGFAGIQRYGTVLWSGDVGNDWESFRRQIAGGLGLQASGVPWWTYDAGGFFRPGDQYTNPDYQQRMLRWIQASVYLPVMRVHGYQSDTEPWEYGEETQKRIEKSINERYRLLPYIYSNAAEVAGKGSTLMRPLIFDFPQDTTALARKYQYMFGKSLLISPVTEADVTEWATYLPGNKGGWFDFATNQHHGGGITVSRPVDLNSIPVYVKAGSIVPYGMELQHSSANPGALIEVRIYPGDDAEFTLYDDDGTSMSHLAGECSRILLKWDDASRQLTIGERNGEYAGMPVNREFTVVLPDGQKKTIDYDGNAKIIKF